MIVLHNKRTVFVSTAKAGTHTIFRILKALGGVQQDGRFHRKAIPAECNIQGWRVVTCVRNPYTRAVSAWWHLTHREPVYDLWPTFDIFLDFLVAGDYAAVVGNLACVPQAEWLADVPYDFAMHLETLASDLRLLGLWPGTEPLPHEHHTPYETPELTPARRRKIEQWAAADFETFGYDMVTP